VHAGAIPDYEPVDLGAWSNFRLPGSAADSIGSGETAYRGIPFLIGRPAPGECHVIGFGTEVSLDPVRIPLEGHAHHLIVAHAMVGSESASTPFGTVCARYVVRFRDGRELETSVRERFEIGPAPTGLGRRPLFTFADTDDQLLPRYRGEWALAGLRASEAVEGWPRAFYLWPWRNTEPNVALESLTIYPAGPAFYIGGVTLGRSDESPFPTSAKKALVIDLDCRCAAQDVGGGSGPSEGKLHTAIFPFPRTPIRLHVAVDRGFATYPYRLPTATGDRLGQSVVPGWGESESPACGPAYVELTATPSASITVSHDGAELGTVRWSELQSAGEMRLGDRARVKVIDNPRNWVRTTVVDDETGRPIPCRIHFRSTEGIPFQPHGHHNHVNADLDSWNIDVGGDVRLGHTTYAYIDGECEGWLPRGDVLVDAARGFEYEPVRERIRIDPDQRVLQLRMRRITDLQRAGYFSGDTHVHFLSTQGAHLEAAGEGLNVVNLLLAQWGNLFTSTEEFSGEPSVSRNGETIIYACQENRQQILGHLILLGTKRPVAPWASDRVGPSEPGSNLETTMARWADECHAQGGTVILPHFPLPATWEFAGLIATGRADAVELFMRNREGHEEYYRYLNAGYRLPVVGGTDKMDADTPVGLYRTYVQVPADEPFDYETWCKYLRRGRTYQTSGPLLSFSVEGNRSGDTVTLPADGGHVEVDVRAESVVPFSSLEIVVNGQVVARTEADGPVRRLTLRETIRVSRHSWIAARCGGKTYYEGSLHHDSWRRGVMAHTSPVYVAVGGPWEMFDPEITSYMTTLLEAGIQYIRERALRWPEGDVLHRHGHDDHLAFLEEPFHEAIAALGRRLDAGGSFATDTSR
jgi:hypothetical protein